MAKLINEEIGRVTVSAEGGTKIVMYGVQAVKVLKLIQSLTGADLTDNTDVCYYSTTQAITEQQYDMFAAGGGVNLVTGELYEVRDVAMEA